MQRRYDRLIIVQRATVAQNAIGEEVLTWVDLVYRCPAFVAPVRGGERFGDPEKVATFENVFTIRFHSIASASRPLSPKDRILYPVDNLAANTQAPATYLIHDILAVDVVGRDIDLAIRARQRADVTTS